MNLGFLASHGGSSVEAILKSIDSGRLKADPKIIISNNSKAGVLNHAKTYGGLGIVLNENNFPSGFRSLDEAILYHLENRDVDLVVLAGYMKKLGDRVLSAYHNRIVNIHPSLLPEHGGLGMYGDRVHEAVLASGDEMTGVTVHLVDSLYDHGRILDQMEVCVYPDDSVDSLRKRVLSLEHVFYSKVLSDIERGVIDLDGD